MSSSPRLQRLVSQPFAENTYVLWREGGRDAVVIDPGLEPELIAEALDAAGLRPVAILNTHGHADHIAGNAEMKRLYPDAPLMIGAGDAGMLTDPDANLSTMFGFAIVSPPADRELRGGDVLELAGFRLEVVEVPGHSAGHVAFLCRESPHIIFGGDVLMQGSIGRSDFPGGDAGALYESIREHFFTLPGDAVVCPGHGPETTVGEEKRHNPFVRHLAK